MKNDVVIRAEGLGKCYLIGHKAERERYVALRDVIARSARGLCRKTADMARGRAIVAGDITEEFWALKDVDFEVRRGEVLGIIGRNGAGKSTLLKILSRITEPSEGRVMISGSMGSLLEVGTGFHPELSGRENIYLNGAILGMTRAAIRRKFDEIVTFADIEQFLDTPVKRYSSGMHVRLAFSVAAHLDVEIMAIDEVLAVGDAEFQKRCLGKMDDAARSGRTVLFVSHNMNALERLSQRLICLEGGRVTGIHDDVRSGIAAYLTSVQGVGGASVWTVQNASSTYENDYFVPSRFEVVSSRPGVCPGRFSNDYPLEVRIYGETRRVDPSIDIGIGVYRPDGEFLFCSFAKDTPKDSWPNLTPRHLRLTVKIPSHLLNEGEYLAELYVKSFGRWILGQRDNTPTVSFVINGGLSDSPLWMYKRAGILAPILEWSSSRTHPAEQNTTSLT